MVAEGAALHAEDEAERFDVLGEVGKGKGDGFALVEIVKLEALEIAHEDVPRALSIGQGVEILASLFVGLA